MIYTDPTKTHLNKTISTLPPIQAAASRPSDAEFADAILRANALHAEYEVDQTDAKFLAWYHADGEVSRMLRERQDATARGLS